MRLLITGSRDWVHTDTMHKALDVVLNESVGQPLVVVHGGAKGADLTADYWARQWATAGSDVSVEEHPAEWGVHGRAAGPIRNQQMVDAGADLVLAFIRNNSPGASHLVRQARRAGIPVREYHENTEAAVTEESTTTETMSLVQRLVAVKKEIGAVGKGDRNAAQGFNFRGIDAVLNAVAGPLMKHGVMVFPSVVEVNKGTATTAKGSTMNTYVLTVDYTFTDGEESLVTRVVGEAFDSGDKAATKAMSVAYRTALIQALSLPTDEPDPDHDVYDAAPEIPQMSDAALIAEIEARDDVDEVKELWAEQRMHLRSVDIQGAIKKRVEVLNGQQSA